MGCCISKSSSNVILPIRVTWATCRPFVPPISSGHVLKVYDGDTITVASKLPYPNSPWYRFQVRLRGIDAPELRSKSAQEVGAAMLSKQALADLVLNKVVFLRDIGTEKYGRLLANVYFGSLSVNSYMLERGLARPYDGKTKKPFDEPR